MIFHRLDPNHAHHDHDFHVQRLFIDNLEIHLCFWTLRVCLSLDGLFKLILLPKFIRTINEFLTFCFRVHPFAQSNRFYMFLFSQGSCVFQLNHYLSSKFPVTSTLTQLAPFFNLFRLNSAQLATSPTKKSYSA